MKFDSWLGGQRIDEDMELAEKLQGSYQSCVLAVWRKPGEFPAVANHLTTNECYYMCSTLHFVGRG